ncbi:MAG: hypothetical protein MI922_02220 [Bacteroidales bacterium]|nr:hypothetical protein [Bacteroidales bacterium]
MRTLIIMFSLVLPLLGYAQVSTLTTYASTTPVFSTENEKSIKSNAKLIHQTFDVYAIYDEDGIAGIDLNVDTNPVNQLLNIKLKEQLNNKLFYELVCREGKVLQTNRLHSSSNYLDFSNYKSSIYLVRIYNSSKLVTIYRIVKN